MYVFYTLQVLLILSGADIDVNDEMHNTPVHLTCSPSVFNDPKWPPRQELNCLKLLVKRGCFVNLYNLNEETPLHRAVELGNEDVVDYLLDHNALVYPNLIRTAALTFKSPLILYSLLEQCSRFDEDLLIAILIVLIVSQNSQWMLNTDGFEELDHKIAMTIIKSIYNFPTPLLNILLKDEYELKNTFGLDHYEKFVPQVAEDIQHFGLMGLALKHGKFSIAWMVYLAGCTPTRNLTLNKADFIKSIKFLPRVKQWLPQAVSVPLSLKLMCRETVRSMYRDETFIVVPDDLLKFVEFGDLDSIKPHDLGISTKRERILDISYSNRETAKAAVQQTLWLYQHWEQ